MSDQALERPSSFVIEGSDSFKIAQSLYNAVTGKTENLSKKYSDNYKIAQNDLDQLHSKIKQMCSQWNVIESNSSLTVHHIDENKETFSSYERFKFYDLSQTSPIESIVYTYDLLLQISGIEKLQPYKITIRIDSKVAIQKKTKEEMGPSASFFMRLFRGAVINADIEYVDYNVARNITSTIDSWASAITCTKKSKCLLFLHSYSHLFPLVVSYIFFIIGVMSCVTYLDFSSTKDLNEANLAKYLITSSGLLFTALFAGRLVGMLAERSVDGISQVSYIKLNVGDDRLIGEAEKQNSIQLYKALLSIVFLTLHAVTCSLVAALFFDWLIK